MTLRALVIAIFALALPLQSLAAQRAAPMPSPSRLPAAQAPRAPCSSPDGPQPDGTIRCEMCPAAPGSRVQYRPLACTNGKWTDAGPCADGDCAGRTY